MDSPSLAIVIPYFKPDFFEETLLSLANQSDQCFSIYIGNDASPVDPQQLIQETLGQRKYNYYHYTENKGGTNPALQWERILENVTEDFFMILGDDDFISNNFIESFNKNLNTILKEQYNVVKFNQIQIDSIGTPLTPDLTSAPVISPALNLEKNIVHNERSSLSEYVFKTKKYKEIGFKHFPFAWGTDNIAVLEIADNQPIFFIQNAKVFVRISEISISGNQLLHDKKWNAKIEYQKYLLKKHYKTITPATLALLLKQHLYLWKYKNIKLDFSIWKLFPYVKDKRIFINYLVTLIKK